MTDKIAALVEALAAFVVGVVTGFVKGWQLALVIIALSPLLAIAGAFMGADLVLTL